MKIFFSIVLLVSTINFYGQNDVNAVKLLDKVSLKIDKADTYKIEFSFHTDDNINQKEKGVVIIKKDNYVLDFFGVKQICDSKLIYTIVPENKEVIISNILNEKKENLSPSNLLKFYRDGYEIKIEKSKKESSFLIQYIKLIPIENSLEISHLLIGINTSNSDIFKVIEFGKNKSKITLEINNIFYNSEFSDDIFIFNENDYLDYYIERL
tara:strand:- start:2217 stop:2846 length:630 start_codon:yes stop_codon:yes gene_type:complete